MKAIWAAGMAVAAGLTLGCASVGDPFDVEGVRKIQIGKTTRNEVRQMFGEPWRTGVDSGQKTWTYGQYKYSLFGSSDSRDLVVRFDDSGRVASYTFNSTYPEDREL